VLACREGITEVENVIKGDHVRENRDVLWVSNVTWNNQEDRNTTQQRNSETVR
jgi:hypothetical protein